MHLFIKKNTQFIKKKKKNGVRTDGGDVLSLLFCYLFVDIVLFCLRFFFSPDDPFFFVCVCHLFESEIG